MIFKIKILVIILLIQYSLIVFGMDFNEKILSELKRNELKTLSYSSNIWKIISDIKPTGDDYYALYIDTYGLPKKIGGDGSICATNHEQHKLSMRYEKSYDSFIVLNKNEIKKIYSVEIFYSDNSCNEFNVNEFINILNIDKDVNVSKVFDSIFSIAKYEKKYASAKFESFPAHIKGEFIKNPSMSIKSINFDMDKNISVVYVYNSKDFFSFSLVISNVFFRVLLTVLATCLI